MHDGGAFTQVGPQTDSGSVRNADPRRDHIVSHLWEFIDACDFEHRAFQSGVQLALRELFKVDRPLVRPRHIRQQAE